MARQQCVVCSEREAFALCTLLDNGDTQYVCIFCMPWWIQSLWEVNGLPELVLDVADTDAEVMGDNLPAAGGQPDATGAATERPADMDDAEWEASGAAGRPDFGAVGADPEPDAETEDADQPGQTSNVAG